MGLMFSCLDTSIVSTALVSISMDLDNDYLKAPWAILAYLLTYMSESLSEMFAWSGVVLTSTRQVWPLVSPN
jgi:hypothetical protein